MKMHFNIMKKFILIAFVIITSASCAKGFARSGNNTIEINKKDPLLIKEIPKPKKIINTTRNADFLDLEAPLRCSISGKNEKIITAIPSDEKAFSIVKSEESDALPRFEVTGYSFFQQSLDAALQKLLDEAKIKVYAADGPYVTISAKNLKGELDSVVGKICDSGNLFYQYYKDRKSLILKRSVDWSVKTIKSKPLLMAMSDILRGSGINDITLDWEDYTINFKGDFEVFEKVRKLVEYVNKDPILFTFDITVYRVYPQNQGGVLWQDLIKAFGADTIKIVNKGALGRMLVVGPEIDNENLEAFLSRTSKFHNITEGSLFLPNNWESRFDIGRCARYDVAENQISLLIKSEINQKDNKLYSSITIDTENGEVARFNSKNRFGENYLIIGIPAETFGVSAQGGETVVLLSPKMIKVLPFEPIVIKPQVQEKIKIEEKKLKEKTLGDKLLDEEEIIEE